MVAGVGSEEEKGCKEKEDRIVEDVRRREEDQQDERRPRSARRAASINFLYRPLPPMTAEA